MVLVCTNASCGDENRAKAPQEHTPHRMQPQVAGSCALDALYGDPERARNRRDHAADSVAAGLGAFRCLFARVRAAATRSSQSAETAHTTSDPASSGWLLCLACLAWTPERVRNRRHAPAASAVAFLGALRCLFTRHGAVATKIEPKCSKSTRRVGCSLKWLAPAPWMPYTEP
jgi:hypothetical protein